MTSVEPTAEPGRRQLLAASGGGIALGIAFAGSLDSLFGAASEAQSAQAVHQPKAPKGVGYGPLVPDPKGVLDLPKGFKYIAFGAEGDPLGDGKVPGKHDGMATFPGRRGTTILVRNHEQTGSGVKPTAPDELVYDPEAYGGTTTLEVDRKGRLVGQYVSLAGTSTNCAGGPTPWGTWLTCEETEGFSGETKSHGWVFEVDARGRRTRPEPIKGMGRFPHEAVAVDRETKVAYLTEDAKGPFGLFYRFTPEETHGGYGAYQAGGLLEAMHVPDVPDLSVVQEPGTVLDGVRWVEIPDPSAKETSTREQLENVSRGQKLEGAWWCRGSAYFVSSFARPSDGSAGEHVGQVWRYQPKLRRLTLETVFKPGATKFDSPDNITVSPYGGGVVLAEDGDGEQYLVGTTRDGTPFPIARNALNEHEFAGVTFSADGKTLFANRQTPGITFAITGPWSRLSG